MGEIRDARRWTTRVKERMDSLEWNRIEGKNVKRLVSNLGYLRLAGNWRTVLYCKRVWVRRMVWCSGVRIEAEKGLGWG